MTKLTLTLDIATYWLHARGEGGGADFDLVMDTDNEGLPLLRGRQVTGLLRLALTRAEAWGWFDTEKAEKSGKGEIAALAKAIKGNKGDATYLITELLVGARSDGRWKGLESIPGCLAIGSAVVPERIRKALVDPATDKIDAATKAALFRRVESTAIDELRGVAKEKHLRSVEAAIPLPLAFDVAFAPEDLRAYMHHQPDELAALNVIAEKWRSWLEIAWPLLDEVGAKRTRGFGRLRFSKFPNDKAGEARS